MGHITGYIREVYRCVWIQTLMIYPDYVRQNYGTELYLKTIKLLSTYYHLDKVRLTVIDANKTAHAFWLSLDFKALFKFNKKIDNKNVSVTIYEKNIIEDYKGGPYE